MKRETAKMRGILFKPDLLAKILAGEKTVTRRTHLAWAKVRKGDRLYVKEGLRLDECEHDHGLAAFADGALARVDGQAVQWRWERDWLSPLHMPAACARTFLVATEDARTERLHALTEAGAKAEGVPAFFNRFPNWGREQRIGPYACEEYPYLTSFICLWDELHADKGNGWSTDPLVAVVTFALEVRS